MNRTERLAILRDGTEAAWPVCLGFVPIGMALGVLARQAGFSFLDIGLMSLLVFAGSAQFIAVALIGAGAALLAPGLLVSGAERSLDLGKPELFAAIPTLLLALRTRSLGTPVISGMSFFWLIKHWI